MAYRLRGKLSTDTQPNDYTYVRIGMPTVVRAQSFDQTDGVRLATAGLVGRSQGVDLYGYDRATSNGSLVGGDAASKCAAWYGARESNGEMRFNWSGHPTSGSVYFRWTPPSGESVDFDGAGEASRVFVRESPIAGVFNGALPVAGTLYVYEDRERRRLISMRTGRGIKQVVGAVNPPAAGDLALPRVRTVRASRLGVTRVMRGYPRVTAGSDEPTRRTFTGHINPAPPPDYYQPLDMADAERVRYWYEQRQRIRLEQDAFGFNVAGEYAHSMRNHGDQLIESFEMDEYDPIMGVPMQVDYRLVLVALTQAPIVA